MADQLNGLFDSNMPVISPSLTDRILGENGSQTGAITLQAVKNLVRGTVSKTRAEMLSLISSSGLVVGERYYISDKGLVADAVATNAISSHVILLSDPSSIYYYDITNDVLGTGIKLSGWGEPKGGYIFDGVNDYVSIPYTQKTKGFSVWVKPTANTKSILNFGTNLDLSINSSNVLTVGSGITNATIYVNGKATTTIALNVWNYIFVVCDEFTPTVLEIGRYSTNYYLGFSSLVRTFNRTYTLAEIITIYNNGLQGQNALPIADVGANNTELITNGAFDSSTGWFFNPSIWEISGGTANVIGNMDTGSGTGMQQANKLIIGKKYKTTFTISNYTGGTIYHNWQFSSSITANGTYTVEFIAISTQWWISGNATARFSVDNVSCIPIGCVAEYLPENAGDYSWYDSSGNRLHGEVVSSAGAGGASPLFRQLIQKATTGNFTTNIASGVASKVIYCPPGYSINSIAVRNTLASGNITDFQAVMAGVNLVTGKTINNAKSVIFKSIADHEISTSPQAITFTATGNGTGGIEISVAFFRRD